MKVVFDFATVFLLSDKDNKLPFITAKVSMSSQSLVAAGLIDMVESKPLYIVVAHSTIDDEEQLKKMLEQALVKETIAGKLVWNSIWFSDFTQPEVKEVIAPAAPSSLKDRYSGRVKFDRSVQYKD